jgi:hypothetical protein
MHSQSTEVNRASHRMNRIHVYFGVIGFSGSPDAVTELLGIAPTSAWATGDPGIRGQPRRFARWALASPAGEDASVEDQLAALLPLLEARAAAVAEAARRFEAAIQCAACFREANPGFHLDAALVARVAALGLSLDFDLYCLGAAADDETTGTAG